MEARHHPRGSLPRNQEADATIPEQGGTTMTIIEQASRHKDPVYVPGRTERETRRLILAAELLNPFTRRMLHDAGLQQGMRVLDIGTGAGDVALVPPTSSARAGASSGWTPTRRSSPRPSPAPRRQAWTMSASSPGTAAK
jgi:hypothetical protein